MGCYANCVTCIVDVTRTNIVNDWVVGINIVS